MQYYVLLSCATTAVAALTALLWLKTRNISFVLGAAYLYFWTLKGAWVLVHDKMANRSAGYTYSYLEEQMFPIYLNRSYFEALLLYSVFLVVALGTVLLVVKNRNSQQSPIRRVVLSHARLLLLAATAAAGSFAIMHGNLAQAAELDYSGYEFTRGNVMADMSPLFTLHQLLNQCALLSTSIGISVLSSAKQGVILTAKRSPLDVFGYVAMAALLIAYQTVLGNRSEMMFCAATGGLLYIANARRPRWAFMAVATVLILFCANAIEFSRGASVRDLPAKLATYDPFDLFSFENKSNEQFAAHFSMYGAIQRRIEPTYGSSIVSLVASVVPSIVWRTRPPSIYAYYAHETQATPGQGYTIHYATAWYLNFGSPGVVLGALVLGLLWGKCFNSFYTRAPGRGSLTAAIATMAPWTFVAFLPVLIRDGPEQYKGWLLQAVLLPGLILVFSTVRKTAIKERCAITKEIATRAA